MTDAERAELRGLAIAATPGPWEHWECGHRLLGFDIGPTDESAPSIASGSRGMFEREEDAAYCAAASPATVLALLDDRDRLAAEVARLRAALERIAQLHSDAMGLSGVRFALENRQAIARQALERKEG